MDASPFLQFRKFFLQFMRFFLSLNLRPIITIFTYYVNRFINRLFPFFS